MLLAGTASMLWSSAFVTAGFLLGGGARKIDPLTLTGLRYFLGGAIILGVCMISRRSLRFTSKRQFFLTLGTALQLYLLTSFLSFMGQKTVTATAGALLVDAGPVILMAFWNLFMLKSSKAELFSVSVAAVGALMVLNILTPSGIFYDGGKLIGQLFCIAAAVVWITGSRCTKALMESGGDPLVLTGWCEVVAAVMAVFPSALAYIAWGLALKQCEMWKLLLTQNLTPVFTMIGSFLLLGEKLTFFNIAGMGRVFCGLFAVVLAGRQKKSLPVEEETGVREESFAVNSENI